MQSNIIDFTAFRTPRPPRPVATFPKARQAENGTKFYLRLDEDDPTYDHHSVRGLFSIGGAVEIGVSAPAEYCEKYLEDLCRTVSTCAGNPGWLVDFAAVIEGSEEGGWFVSIIWRIPDWVTDDRLLAAISTLQPEHNVALCCLETCSLTEVRHLLGRLGLIRF